MLTLASEDEECFVFTEWLQYQQNLKNIFKFSHIPNETPAVKRVNGVWKKNYKTLARLKRLGVNKGIPDYIIIVSTGTVVMVEMKRVKGSTTSNEQKEWIKYFNLCGDSVHAKICKGADEAIKFVEEYFPYNK